MGSPVVEHRTAFVVAGIVRILVEGIVLVAEDIDLVGHKSPGLLLEYRLDRHRNGLAVGSLVVRPVLERS